MEYAHCLGRVWSQRLTTKVYHRTDRSFQSKGLEVFSQIDSKLKINEGSKIDFFCFCSFFVQVNRRPKSKKNEEVK